MLCGSSPMHLHAPTAIRALHRQRGPAEVQVVLSSRPWMGPGRAEAPYGLNWRVLIPSTSRCCIRILLVMVNCAPQGMQVSPLHRTLPE